MDLKNLQKNWNAFGQRDPFWAILTHPDKKGNRWDAEEFFGTGIDEVESAVKYISSLRPELRRRRALDFGCGVGRLTQALAVHFEETYGVDIAASMLTVAEQFNRRGKGVKYLLNQKNDLKIFADCSFDFIYSNIVLQHMDPVFALNYLKEFLRILAPGGLILFHLPSEPTFVREATARRTDPDGAFGQLGVNMDKVYRRARSILRWYAWRATAMLPLLRGPQMEMYGIPRNEVERFLGASGGIVVDVRESNSAGLDWKAFQYCVSKSE